MAKKDDENDEDREAKRARRRQAAERQAASPTNDPAPRRNIAEPTTDYRGSGEFDRNSALERTMETGQMIPRNHFDNEDEWAEYFATVPQEIKRAHRAKAAANQERVYAGLADGMSLADLGITDEKEHGRALFRRLTSFGLLDPNWEYNWETGQKRNVGTSDLGARNRWQSIDPSEFRERQTHQAAGGDFAGRIAGDATNRMNRAIAEGVFVRDPETGLLINPGPNGAQAYYDDRGYAVDPRTRQRIGGGHSGHIYGGGRQSGAGVFGGVGGAWGQNTPAANPQQPAPPLTPNPNVPLAPPKPMNPYYRPPTNPWGSPNKSMASGGSFSTPIPLKKKMVFGAPQ